MTQEKRGRLAAVALVEHILGRKLAHNEKRYVKGDGSHLELSGRIARLVAEKEGIPPPPRRRAAC